MDHSLTAFCMHTASDVFVILKTGRSPRSSPSRKSVAVDHRSVPKKWADNTSLADRAPVSLGRAITGIEERYVGLLVKAVLHASGRRQFPR